MTAFWHAAEVIIIGIVVTGVGALVDGFTNYHPTGQAATIWGMVGIVVIGALKGLYSWLMTKQAALGGQNTQSTSTGTPK